MKRTNAWRSEVTSVIGSRAYSGLCEYFLYNGLPMRRLDEEQSARLLRIGGVYVVRVYLSSSATGEVVVSERAGRLMLSDVCAGLRFWASLAKTHNLTLADGMDLKRLKKLVAVFLDFGIWSNADLEDHNLAVRLLKGDA